MLLTLLLSGCYARLHREEIKLRKIASADLQCPPDNLEIKYSAEPLIDVVTGCGREARYHRSCNGFMLTIKGFVGDSCSTTRIEPEPAAEPGPREPR